MVEGVGESKKGEERCREYEMVLEKDGGVGGGKGCGKGMGREAEAG